MSEDYGKKIIDVVQLAELRADQRELDTLKAVNEMVGIAAEMMASIAADTGPRAPDPEELMRREAELIAKWPEACRRAGVGAIPMPDEMMRGITSFVGRAS